MMLGSILIGGLKKCHKKAQKFLGFFAYAILPPIVNENPPVMY